MTIGVCLDATNISVGIIEGGVIYRKISDSFPFAGSEEETIAHLINSIARLMNSNIKGIGVGVPSIVDARLGIVYNAINIPSWREVHLKQILEEEFRVPVCVNNDSNCFAFGERYCGEGTPYRSIVGIIMGTGLGAGIIINDMLYEGYNTGAGEIGCLPYLDQSYENYCASDFFKRKNTSAEIEFMNAENGDEAALEMWNEFGWHVGNLIKTVLFTYDPEAIILGGAISKAYPYFSKKMFESMQSFPYIQALMRIKILVSRKEDVTLLGAAALIP